MNEILFSVTLVNDIIELTIFDEQHTSSILLDTGQAMILASLLNPNGQKPSRFLSFAQEMVFDDL